MSGLVEGKVALVTGGASGIGRATVCALADEGAKVLVCDLDDAAGEALAKELGDAARFLHVDVTSPEDVSAMVQTALDGFGRLDCAVNNAGTTGGMGSLPDIDLEAWHHTLDTNLTSVFLCLKYEIPVMQQQGGGSIVNVASGAGMIAVPALSPYCASKHGVLGLTKTAAVENARTGVRVNAICPGTTDTPMLRSAMQASPAMEKMILGSAPSGRLGRPEEVAAAAVWLCSERASYVSGESMLVDLATIAR